MIALSFNFIESHLSLLKYQDLTDIDLSIIKEISVTFSFYFFIFSNWFNNINMKKYDDTYSKDNNNDEN